MQKNKVGQVRETQENRNNSILDLGLRELSTDSISAWNAEEVPSQQLKSKQKVTPLPLNLILRKDFLGKDADSKNAVTERKNSRRNNYQADSGSRKQATPAKFVNNLQRFKEKRLQQFQNNYSSSDATALPGLFTINGGANRRTLDPSKNSIHKQAKLNNQKLNFSTLRPDLHEDTSHREVQPLFQATKAILVRLPNKMLQTLVPSNISNLRPSAFKFKLREQVKYAVNKINNEIRLQQRLAHLQQAQHVNVKEYRTKSLTPRKVDEGFLRSQHLQVSPYKFY